VAGLFILFLVDAGGGGGNLPDRVKGVQGGLLDEYAGIIIGAGK
jgi:hypothetical protein